MLFEDDHPKSIGFRKKKQSLVAWGPGGCNSRFNWAQVNQGQPVSPLCFRPQAAGTHRFSSTGAEGAGDLRSHSAPHFHRNLSTEAHEKIREIDRQKYVLRKGEGTDVCGILFFLSKGKLLNLHESCYHVLSTTNSSDVQCPLCSSHGLISAS